jgi:hypothetical protein
VRSIVVLSLFLGFEFVVSAKLRCSFFMVVVGGKAQGKGN